MNYVQWCRLADVLLDHLDPNAPENVVVVHIADEAIELERLELQRRLPAW